jgi:hypothetical protein
MTKREPQVTGGQKVDPSLMRALGALMNQLNGKKHRTIAWGSEVPNKSMLRRPFGVTDLDIDTAGGLPAGDMSYLSGPDNGGKTYLMLMLMRMNQLLYGPRSSICYAALEDDFDFMFARKLGVRVAVPPSMIEQLDAVRKLRGAPRLSKEELAWLEDGMGAFTIVKEQGEAAAQALLKIVRSNLFQLVFIDSISVLKPSAELEKDMNKDERMAGRAGLRTRFDLNYTAGKNDLDDVNYTTLVCSSQVRANMERANAPSHIQKYIKPYYETGAYSSRHIKVIDVQISSGEKIYKKVGGESRLAGKMMKWELIKGKKGAHDNTRGEAPYYYEGHGEPLGIDPVGSLVQAAVNRSVIKVTEGGRMKMLNPATRAYEDLADDETSLRAQLAGDFGFELMLRREVLASAGVECLYGP